MQSFVKPSRPQVTIDLVGQKNGLVPSYTTWDHIDGTAAVEVDHDTPFDEVEITLEGTAKTAVERVSLPGQTEASLGLLKLRQPLGDAAYPTPRILEKGRTYRFPFTFVVPDRLLPQACRHPKNSATAERAHTSLPPSLGDPMIATNGKSLLDDMSPEMSQILYRVQVNVLQKSPTSGKPAKSVAAVAKKIRIIPTVEEEPPLDVSHHKGAYCDRKEKDVRRGLLRGKFGRISVTTSQPKPVQLVLGGEPGDSVGSVATVHLRFDPMQGEEPPRLSSLGTKLRVSTYYTNNPYHNHPSHVSYGEPGRSIYVHMVPLSTLCVASAQWTKHTGARRGSVDSVSSIGSGATYYTSSIIVPISLPKSKAFVPTFESCLISRFYGIDLDISYRTPATNLLNPSICLKIPIQLTCRPKVDPDASPSFMTTKEEIDEIFCPRSIAPPSPEYTEWADRSD